MAKKNLSRNLVSSKTVLIEAERIAGQLTLTPKGSRPFYLQNTWKHVGLRGVLTEKEVARQIGGLGKMSVDAYIRHTIAPIDHPKRKSAPEIIRQLGGEILHEEQFGPLHVAEIDFVMGQRKQRVVTLSQDRRQRNGVWEPRHHQRASELVRFYSSLNVPLVCFIDTPGADASAEANAQNQAHSISNLITEITSLPQPNIGVVLGNGYSGGAIPLASAHILLAVRDGAFNTIHPQGLSDIAHRYNLSWQECAQYVGVSAYELFEQGVLDGVVDYSPLDSEPPIPLRDAILSAIEMIEEQAAAFMEKEEHHYFFEHYKRNILNYLNPSQLLIEENRKEIKTPTGRLNVFGVVFRFLRYMRLRLRLKSQSALHISRLHTESLPAGELKARLEKEKSRRFQQWLESPIELRYDDVLLGCYKKMQGARNAAQQPKGRGLGRFFIGDPQARLRKRSQQLCMEIVLYLYNFWKSDSLDNFGRLLNQLQIWTPQDPPPADKATLIEAIRIPEVLKELPFMTTNVMLFDLLYNRIIDNLHSIADELRRTNQITHTTLENLLEKALAQASNQCHGVDEVVGDKAQQQVHFSQFLEHLIGRRDVSGLMHKVGNWKRLAFPRLSEPLFGVLTHLFTDILPSFYESTQEGKPFNGKISPRQIGIKNFWHRLDQAYRDLLIQNLLNACKQQRTITPKIIIDTLFSDFEEHDENIITSDPMRFPGLRHSVEKALSNNVRPVGVVTGLATFSTPEVTSRVGVVVSNLQFQAGAFDMASGEKVCHVIAQCAHRRLPIIFFISSGGMQTKEGAGSLFSMAVLNSRITRFVKDFDLPVICFGFRDCTGGAQASFVTHALAKTYYLSGASIPFAGQRVVPQHLPTETTLANYLSRQENCMEGLVKNPFDTNLDDDLRSIDPKIPLPTESIEQVVGRILTGEYRPPASSSQATLPSGYISYAPIERVLIHARGATAVRLIQGVQDAKKAVVLVQSDPDMESLPARMLTKNDQLVCLGGNTAQESYLNGQSVIHLALQHGADALHPGIGFLSESPSYAWECRKNGLNFIGPRAQSMELMGNKSNAIATAQKFNTPTAPGSQGVVTDADEALKIAGDIGYPVLIKAAFGGGGKGLRVVHRADAFKEAFERVCQEALAAFGSGDVYLEKFIETMRHIEVQILRDKDGCTLAVGLRDCSVQRDNQKLIEESGSYQLGKAMATRLKERACELANGIDYIGAGTVEFIYDRKAKAFYFMEMNTRLQVEHPVTEMVSGFDIVQEQLNIAQGKSIAHLKPKNGGYAMEVRINAEKMEIDGKGLVGFTPNPGKITLLSLPKHPDIRCISWVETGDNVSPYYDSLMVQIIAKGKSRAAVIGALCGYLKTVHIEGVYTNITLMEAILEDEVFIKGDYDTHYLPKFLERIKPTALVERMHLRHPQNQVTLNLDALRIENSTELKVLSPRGGVFYTTSSPETPPFAPLGKCCNVKQTLCLMEAMKVFESLSLEDFNTPTQVLYPPNQRFVITRVLAENGQTVNRGDLLFIVRPEES